MEIFSKSLSSLMNNWNVILLSVTVIFLFVMLKNVIFRKRPISRKHPCYGISTVFWIIIQNIIKPVHEAQEYICRNYGRTFWIADHKQAYFCTGDPHLIKLLFVKNFKSFSTRTNYPTLGDIFLDNSILFLQNPKWKLFRSSLSPIFTSSKMKKMCPQIENCVQGLINKVSEFSQQSQKVEMKSILREFTFDVIAVTAFDLNVLSTKESREQFFAHAISIVSFTSGFRLFLAFRFSWITKIFGIDMIPRKSVHYFGTIVRNIVQQRRNSLQQQTEPDLIQLLLKHGKEVENAETSMSTKEEFSVDEITANCITFLIAGFETTSSTLCSIIYCLAQNPACQEKLLEEIEKTRNAESPENIPYLEAVISETMRLFPAAPSLNRCAVSDCYVDEIFFPKDTLVMVPVSAMHRDPEFFPDPENFRPDRFLTGDYNVDAYMPFGSGPRKCIGFLFSLMEIRMAIIQLVQNFKFVSIQKELKFRANIPLLIPHEMMVKIEKRVV